MRESCIEGEGERELWRRRESCRYIYTRNECQAADDLTKYGRGSYIPNGQALICRQLYIFLYIYIILHTIFICIIIVYALK